MLETHEGERMGSPLCVLGPFVHQFAVAVADSFVSGPG